MGNYDVPVSVGDYHREDHGVEKIELNRLGFGEVTFKNRTGSLEMSRDEALELANDLWGDD